MPKFLIIQTAFIGDVILATPVIEKIKQRYPQSEIDFLLRKGNEGLLHNHPHLRKVYVWHKKKKKYSDLFQILLNVREERYDYVINIQRFFSTGLFTIFSKGKITIGFDKNPLSFLFSLAIQHQIGNHATFVHEVSRNLSLVASFTDTKFVKPALYPSKEDYDTTRQNSPYVCIAPTSVWYTKQLPAAKWVELINKLDNKFSIILTGSDKDFDACEAIKNATHRNVINLAGKSSFLQSAALFGKAKMNYVNDSAPMHIASAMNAPTIAVFCSTIPAFGFGPLAENSRVIETNEKLDCRPCGLHGFKQCPKGHFKCADVSIDEMLF